MTYIIVAIRFERKICIAIQYKFNRQKKRRKKKTKVSVWPVEVPRHFSRFFPLFLNIELDHVIGKRKIHGVDLDLATVFAG